MFAEVGVLLPEWVRLQVIQANQYYVEEDVEADCLNVYEILPDCEGEKTLLYKEKDANWILVAYKESYSLHLLDTFTPTDSRFSSTEDDADAYESIVSYLRDNSLVPRCSSFICDENLEENIEWEENYSESFVRGWYYVSSWLASTLSMAGEKILPLGNHYLWGYSGIGNPTEDSSILNDILDKMKSK